jgi:hypothetical protein
MHLNRRVEATPKKGGPKDSKSASTHKLKTQDPFRSQKGERSMARSPLGQMEVRDLFRGQNGEEPVREPLRANTFKYRVKQMLKEIATNKVENSHVLKNLEHAMLQLREKKQSAFRSLNQRLGEMIQQDESGLQGRIDLVSANLRGLQKAELDIDLLFEAPAIEERTLALLEEQVLAMAPLRNWAAPELPALDLLILTRAEHDALQHALD